MEWAKDCKRILLANDDKTLQQCDPQNGEVLNSRPSSVVWNDWWWWELSPDRHWSLEQMPCASAKRLRNIESDKICATIVPVGNNRGLVIEPSGHYRGS
jgi:hypothetical protein